jgi:NarL family two-component system response regulator LiaR
MTAATTGIIRVALVDDHALVRSAIRQALTAPDVRIVAEAATAEEAMSTIPDTRPDVMLVDVDLPGLDGVNMVREIAARMPATRIVMLSVSSADRDVLDAVRYGAVGYLTKDLTPDALLRAVRGVHRGEFAMGRLMTARLIKRLVGHGTRRTAGDTAPDDLESLSSRELEVLRLLSRGLTDREIADALTISPRTVETHVGSLLRKLRARNRAEAARRYHESGGD